MITLLLLAMLGGCHSDYRRALPNGFRLVRTNAATVAIFEPTRPTSSQSSNLESYNGVLVAPKIVAINIEGDFVFGCVASSEDSELASYGKPGYFILNTKTADLVSALDEESWRAKMKEFGIESVSLRDPRELP
jgi:hypothetical protein